jgi:YjbE family integral membrane protein
MQLMNPAEWGLMFQGFMMEAQTPAYWLAVLQIIWINILLSGDNALVIAMACRGLQPKQRLWGMVLGAGVAVVLRIVFTGIVATLMLLPYLKIVGGLALLYIAVKMLVPDDPDENEVEAVEHLWRAIWTVVVADIIMSLDNVIAIAAAAKGSMSLLVIGLGISIPLIVAGAALIMTLLDRFPILVWAGGALLGWIAGEVIATDPVAIGFVTNNFGADAVHNVSVVAAVVGAIFVVVAGWVWRRSRAASKAQAA